ncbi:MAG: hypothetical protein JNJ45_07125 [Chthonomonas sp.]|nr:hypothetical protein [Chthonomonas sp.]
MDEVELLRSEIESKARFANLFARYYRDPQAGISNELQQEIASLEPVSEIRDLLSKYDAFSFSESLALISVYLSALPVTKQEEKAHALMTFLIEELPNTLSQDRMLTVRRVLSGYILRDEQTQQFQTLTSHFRPLLEKDIELFIHVQERIQRIHKYDSASNRASEGQFAEAMQLLDNITIDRELRYLLFCSEELAIHEANSLTQLALASFPALLDEAGVLKIVEIINEYLDSGDSIHYLRLIHETCNNFLHKMLEDGVELQISLRPLPDDL